VLLFGPILLGQLGQATLGTRIRGDQSIIASGDHLLVPDPLRLQHPADAARGNPQLRSDFCHGQTFRVEPSQLVAVYDQPRASADASLLAGLLEPGDRALAYPDALLLGDSWPKCSTRRL
jgi:hypothetical protein